MSEVVLRTVGLTKRFGDLVAVDGLTLAVRQGEVFGFLGPNGAGKTTSINMMCGLLVPDAGRVTVRGVPITEAGDDVRARVGVCPQEIVLWERLTCIEQLQFIGQMYGLSGRDARRSGERLLEELDLTAKRNSQARTLSGGMQRRLNLAMALVHDPEIVVLDEPGAGLDPQSRVKVREYIQSLARIKTVILTTHNMDEADRLADRVAIIDHGRLLVLDTPEALKRGVGEGDVVEIELSARPDVATSSDAPLDRAPAERVRARLTDAVGESWLNGRGSVVSVRARNAVSALPTILAEIEAAGLAASDMRVRRNTLEDVFIQLTGRRLRE